MTSLVLFTFQLIPKAIKQQCSTVSYLWCWLEFFGKISVSKCLIVWVVVTSGQRILMKGHITGGPPPKVLLPPGVSRPPTNTRFHGPTKVSNGILIGSAISAQLAIITNIETYIHRKRPCFSANSRPLFILCIVMWHNNNSITCNVHSFKDILMRAVGSNKLYVAGRYQARRGWSTIFLWWMLWYCMLVHKQFSIYTAKVRLQERRPLHIRLTWTCFRILPLIWTLKVDASSLLYLSFDRLCLLVVYSFASIITNWVF